MEAERGKPNPGLLYQIGLGFMGAKFMFAAGELGLFEKLGEGPATLTELAKRLGIEPRMARMVSDANVGLGLVERDGEHYRNSPTAQAFLTGQGPMDLRGLLRILDRICYPRWQKLADSLKHHRAATEGLALDADQSVIWQDGIAAFTLMVARMLPDAYDFSSHRVLADLGGGTGSFLLPVLRRYPGLKGVLYEMPNVIELARPLLDAQSIADRVELVDGDVLFDPLPRHADVSLVANVMHVLSAAHNIQLLRRIREAAPTGARVLLVDMWTDPTHSQPSLAALMAGEFHLVTGEGDVYSVDEVKGWFAETGWRFVEHRPVAGITSLIVGEVP